MKSPKGNGLAIIIELKKIYAKKAQQHIIISPDSVGQICGFDLIFIFFMFALPLCYSRSSVILIFSFIFSFKSVGISPIFLISLLLSIARI